MSDVCDLQARVAVIGAGIAGITAALALAQVGAEVTVFEKSRGPGGRMSTRRVDAWRFDHGTTVIRRDDVSGSIDASDASGDPRSGGGLAALVSWSPRIIGPRDSIVPTIAAEQRLVAPEGMSRLLEQPASSVDLRPRVAVTAIRRTDGGWTVIDSSSVVHGPFDAIVVAVPAPQCAALLQCSPELRAVAESIESRTEYEPCWALLAAWNAPAEDTGGDSSLDLGWDLWEAPEGSGTLVRIVRESTKPRRPAMEAIVAHAGSAWSTAHLQERPESAATILLDAAQCAVGSERWPRAAPDFVCAHRWRYARPRRWLDVACVEVPGQPIALCGDWCGGRTVGSALRSGSAAAQRIVAALRAGR